MAESLVILGASARAAAQSAIRGGWSPWCADLFADADLARICPATAVRGYRDGLAVAARRAPPGPWMYTGGLENHPALVDAIARDRPLLGNPGAVLERVRDPFLVAAKLRDRGLDAPDVARAGDDLSFDGTWLVKRRRSCGGGHVAAWRGQALADRSGGGWYFQERIAGLPSAAVYIAAKGRAVLLGVTEQLIGQGWTGASGFRYCGSIGPLALSPEALDVFGRLGNALAAEFGLVGIFGVDAILLENRVWPIEVNPRYPSSAEVLERISGVSGVGSHVAACRTGELVDPPANLSGRFAGKAILFASHDTVLSTGQAAALLDCVLDRENPSVADVPRAGEPIAAGRPILTVLTEGATAQAVAERLRSSCYGLRSQIEKPG